MSLINKLTIKNLKLNKKRTIVTIIGIILSVALITAVASMVVSFRQSLIIFEKTSHGNYHFGYDLVPSSDLTYFKNNRNIESFYLTKNIGYANIEESKNEYKPYAFIMAFDNNALNNLGINIIEGRLPENSNEIVIPRHLKTNGRVNYQVGDEITLNVGKRISEGYELHQGNSFTSKDEEYISLVFTNTYKIVGIIERPSNSIEPYSAPGYTFVTLLDDISDEGIYNVYTRYTKKGIKNQYRVTANILGINEDIFESTKGGQILSNVKDVENYLDEIEKSKYQLSVNGTLINLESMSTDDSTMQVLYTLAGIVIIIIIITSVFCIKNSFEISITEKIKQYGMLRSIGATSKQIRKNVLYEALILSIVGIPLGILSGILASFILIHVTNYFLGIGANLKLIYSTSILAIFISIILSLITIYFSARKSAKKASKISPITAIRNSGDIKIKTKRIRTPYLIDKVFGVGGVISYKNLKRSSKKYRTTVISIIVCVSVFIGLTAFIDLGFRMIKMRYGEVNYNLYVGINDKVSKDVISEILSYDDIKRFSTVKNVNYIIRNPKVTEDYAKLDSVYYEDSNQMSVNEFKTSHTAMISLGKEEYKRYINELGLNYNDTKDKVIIINNTIENRYINNKVISYEVDFFNYKSGDILDGYVSYYDGESKTVDKKIIVAKTTSIRPLGYENTYGIPVLVVSDEYMETLPQNDYSYLYIDSSNPDNLQDNIEKILKDVNYSLDNLDKQAKMMQSYYTLIAIFLYGFITVIALIGVTNIFNTVTTNMELRSREFAMLKSIGMTKKEFNRMIRLESLFYGTKSLIIGIPIGTLISYLIFKVLGGSALIIKYTLPFKGIIISIFVVFILIFVIMKYSMNKISKQNTIETIRNENI